MLLSLLSTLQADTSIIANHKEKLLKYSKSYFDKAFVNLKTDTFQRKLIINDMDIEQIYEQINLASNLDLITDPVLISKTEKLMPMMPDPLNGIRNYSNGSSEGTKKAKKIVRWKDNSEDNDDGLAYDESRGKLQEIEQQMLKLATEKPWHMLGEAVVSDRPDNSLLESNLLLDFDRKSKSAPSVTIEHTSYIEEMVKQRIKDFAFDDVERKQMMTTNDSNQHRSEITDDPSLFKKSTKGLADLYEDKYVENLANNEVVDSKLKIQLIDEFKALAAKLDALSHSSFVPKLSLVTEVVNRKVKSVDVEKRAANSNHPELSLPHKLHCPSKELKGADELSATDRKRLKRLKLKQQKMEKIRRKIIEDLKPKSTKKIKSLEERDTLRKVEKLITNSPHVKLAKPVNKSVDNVGKNTKGKTD
ncbi:hypothetical protein GJ496_001830 [Pomphorhynchus laevis]|nr:hypothetical protein GJ496_001830 [Pomphorhynchus laevis]